MQTVALIGYGAIAREVCSALGRASGIRIEQVLVRTGTSQLVQKALPEGITARPASEIMEIDRDLVAATSASFLSNVFRYRMIRDTGAIWIDCDAFCHRPFPEDTDRIFAGHGFRAALNCRIQVEYRLVWGSIPVQEIAVIRT